MFQFPQVEEKNNTGGIQAPNRQGTITICEQDLGTSPMNKSPLDSPVNPLTPRMSLSPQPSMIIDSTNIPPNGNIGMNNFVTTSPMMGQGFAFQNNPMMMNPGPNNMQIQNLQVQLQQIQLQLNMVQQQAMQSPMSPQVIQMQSMLQTQLQMAQSQIQMLQQQNPMNAQIMQLQTQLQMMQMQLQTMSMSQSPMASPVISPVSPSVISPVPQSVPPSLANKAKPFGVAQAYATPKLLSQVDVVRIVEEITGAIKSINMDPSRIINIIGKYTPNQMNQIIESYKSVNKQNLESAVKNATSGNFGKLCVALTKTILDYDVWCLYDAIKGLGTDDDCLVDILVGRSNADIIALNKAYKESYNKTLEDDVKGDTSGDYRKTLVSILQGSRNESGIEHDVETDADALYKAGEGKIGTDEATFINILTNRSYPHLRKVFDKYQQKHSHSMERAINSEFSGNIKKVLVGIVRTTVNLSEYLAEQFENSMKGMGTKNDKLIRLVVRYREPELMKKIKEDYQKLYGKSLSKRIEGETSGDYRKLLLTCIGDL